MGKTIKWILIALGALVGLFVLVLVLAAIFVDPNDYKQEIQDAVADATGMELVIDGDIGLDLFPWIALDVGKVTLKNPAGFGDEPFVVLDSASVGVRVLPLLTGSMEAGDVEVDGLVLNLIRLENGQANWEALSGEKKDETPAEDKPAKTSGKQKDFSIGGVSVTKANIVYDDREQGKRYELKDADITLGSIDPGRPFDLSVAFGVSSSEPEVAADIEITGVVALDMAAKVYSVSGLEATVAATGKAVPGGEAEVSATAEKLAADLTAQTAEAVGLKIMAYNVTATASATGTTILDSPAFTGSLDVASFDVKELLGAMGQTPPETGDPKALSSVAASLGFEYAPGGMKAKDVRLTLDDTTVLAEAAVVGTENPSYVFRADIDAINLDRYLPPKAEGGGTAAEAPAESGPEKPFLSEEVKAQLRKLDLDGRVTVGRVETGKSVVTDVLVTVRGKNGVIDIKPASFNLFDGSFTSTTRLDVSGSTTRANHASTLRNLQIGDLLQAMTGKESLSGNTNADVNISAVGDTVSAFKRTLNGNVAFDVHDGVFPGVDLAGVMDNALTKLKNSASGEVARDEDAKTEFGLLQGTAVIRNGLVTNDDFLLKSPFLQADGEGTVDLPSESVDYLVIGALLATTEGQGRGDKDEELGIGIPIRVRGTFSDLSFWPDPVKWGEMMLGSTGRLLEGGVESMGDLGTGVLDTVIGGEEKGAATEGEAASPAEESSDPVKDVGDKIKGLF